MANEKITRQDAFLNAIKEKTPSGVEPKTHRDLLLDAIARGDDSVAPVTREEAYLADVAKAAMNGGGGGDDEQNWSYTDDVMFFDYDGTVIATYSAEEFLEMTDFPAPPVHEGLTFQQWSIDFYEARDCVSSYGMCDIGATYCPSDHNLHIFVRFEVEQPLMLPLVWNTMHVDWGDGTSSGPEDATSSQYGKVFIHNYSALGTYEVIVSEMQGDILPRGLFVGGEYQAQNLVEKLYIPDRITSLPPGFLQDATFTKYVVLPAQLLSISADAFKGSGLECLVLPKNSNLASDVSGDGFFQNCFNLKLLTIPQNMSIGNGTACFSGCSSLKRLVLPKWLTTFGPGAFANTASLERIMMHRYDVANLGPGLFAYSGLRTLTLSTGITAIADPETSGTGYGTFSGAYSLQSVNCLFNPSNVSGTAPWGATGCTKFSYPNNSAGN